MQLQKTGTSIRGTSIGSIYGPFAPGEPDTAADPVERAVVRYSCPGGHEFAVPFFAGAAKIPLQFDCRCGAIAITDADGAVKSAAHNSPRAKSHLEQLRSRRTTQELETLLAVRLALHRA